MLAVDREAVFFGNANKSGRYSGFTYDGLVIDKITLFRISVIRHSVHVDESKTIRYTYLRSGNRIGNRVSHWSGKQDNPLGSFYREAKERACKHGIHFWFLLPRMRIPGIPGIQTHGRSRLSRTAEINEFYVRCSEGMRKGKSLRCNDFPVKVRLMYVVSCKLPGRHLNGCILPRILFGASRAPITRL